MKRKIIDLPMPYYKPTSNHKSFYYMNLKINNLAYLWLIYSHVSIQNTPASSCCETMGDYRNTFFSLNAQITEIFGLAKSIALPLFWLNLAISKKIRQKVGVSGHPHFCLNLENRHLGQISATCNHINMFLPQTT